MQETVLALRPFSGSRRIKSEEQGALLSRRLGENRRQAFLRVGGRDPASSKAPYRFGGHRGTDELHARRLGANLDQRGPAASTVLVFLEWSLLPRMYFIWGVSEDSEGLGSPTLDPGDSMTSTQVTCSVGGGGNWWGFGVTL